MAGYNARVASQQLSTSASNGRSELPLFSLAADSSLTTCSRADAGAWFNYPFLTSKERDIETGLDYFLARYYSSTQGRFTSPDEFAGGPEQLFYFEQAASENPTFYAELEEPQSLNKYQYALNNPLRYVDPDGHQAMADALRAAAVGGAATGQVEIVAGAVLGYAVYKFVESGAAKKAWD